MRSRSLGRTEIVLNRGVVREVAHVRPGPTRSFGFVGSMSGLPETDMSVIDVAVRPALSGTVPLLSRVPVPVVRPSHPHRIEAG